MNDKISVQKPNRKNAGGQNKLKEIQKNKEEMKRSSKERLKLVKNISSEVTKRKHQKETLVRASPVQVTSSISHSDKSPAREIFSRP